MCHGRPATARNRVEDRLVPVLAVICVCLLSLNTGCGSADVDEESGDSEDRRTWSVDSQSDDSADATDESDGSSDDATSDTAEDTSSGENPDWTAIHCNAGAATAAAFEGRTNDPATRVTVYVRDDCALVGSVAVSVYSGNYSLTIRGSVDAQGNITMAGRNNNHHADVTGAVEADRAVVDVDASFRGTSVEHELTLERIE